MRDPTVMAFGHDLRVEIMLAMRRHGGPISPCEVAALIDEPLTNVSYHMRQLAKGGAIALVEERPARGATKHLYKFVLKAKWALALLDERAKKLTRRGKKKQKQAK